ncbi:mandelate racemase/muconate lactonizing enzyme family protein [bacterium LRH843]|nr:mandelate racemase/muconate lactonizing enzyme family protein [bacterium LRH843]
MKIIDLNTYRIDFNGDMWIWLSIETDKGLIGWGEVTDSGNDGAVAQIINELSKHLIGKDPRNILDCTYEAVKYKFPSMKKNRFFSTAWSGIDQALWDIKSQSFEMPLYWLLGGFGKKQIPLYANLNRGLRKNRTPDALKESGQKAYSEGFSMVKCTPFDEVVPSNHVSDLEPSLNRLKSLLTVVDLSNVSIDFHQRFNQEMLFKVLKEITELGDPFWIEDPIHVEQGDIYSLIRKLYPTLSIAGGENSTSLSCLWELLNANLVSVIMPDVKHVGGVSTIKTIIPLVEERGIKLSLHNPSGPISTAFSAHLSTLCREPFPLEYPWKLNCKRAESSILAEPIAGGMYHLTDRPGIGISPTDDFLKQYGEIWESGMWKSFINLKREVF